MQALSVMQKGYESSTGIFDHFEYENSLSQAPHSKSERVLVSVAMHSSEAFDDTDPFFERLQQYRYLNVKEIYNLTPSEFFAMPRHLVERIITECETELRKTGKDAADVDDMLKKQIGK